LMPKESFTYSIPEKNQIGWEAWLKRHNKDNTMKLEIVFSHLSFGDGTGFTSTGGVYFPVTYKPHLAPEIVTEGRLSDIQLERVIYAGQRHEQRQPDRSLAGFFVGDGTGVGKGRVLAGIIADNWNHCCNMLSSHNRALHRVLD